MVKIGNWEVLKIFQKFIKHGYHNLLIGSISCYDLLC